MANLWEAPTLTNPKRRIVNSDPEIKISIPERRNSLKEKVLTRFRISNKPNNLESPTSASTTSYDTNSRINRSSVEGTNSSARPSTSLTSIDSQDQQLPSSCYMQQPILHAKLRITPEQPYLDGRLDHSLWVSLEISCDVLLPPLNKDKATPTLDVAVILDTSPYSSQETLRRGAELIVQISNLLNRSHDRIACLCTSVDHPGLENSKTGCLFWPLQRPDPVEFEKKLRYLSITKYSPAPQDLDLSETVAAAFRLLSITQFLERGKHEERRGHVIILSPNPAACILDGITDYPIDIVNTGLVPWKQNVLPRDAWNVAASPLVESHFSNVANSLLEHARLGIFGSLVSNLKTDILVADGCNIEQQIGSTEREILQPGQVHFLLFKISIPAWYPEKRPKSLNRSQYEIAKMECFLGLAATNIISVKVSYEHATGRQSSVHFIEEKCHIMRDDATSIWTGRTIEQRSSDITKARSEVCKQLIYAISEQEVSPEDALDGLHFIFDEWDYPPQIALYLSRVRKELEYQMYMNDRHGDLGREALLDANFWTYDKASGEFKPPTIRLKALPIQRRYSTINLTTQRERRDLETIFSEPEIPDIPEHSEAMETDDTPDSASSTVTTIHKNISRPELHHVDEDEMALDMDHMEGKRISSNAFTGSRDNYKKHEAKNEKSSPDEAQRIWRLMRTASNASNRDNNNTASPLSESGLDLKEIALRNKRSIGADTLRSLSFDIRKEGVNQGDAERSSSMPWV